MAAIADQETGGKPGVVWTDALRYYVLGMLTLVAIVNYIDRQIVAILVEPIKADLRITDTEIGLLTGVAFAAFYVLAGIPLARLADTSVRRTLIAACTAFWSLATVACGFTSNFLQLALARIGVASGEAGSSPATQSILADLFPIAKRGKALGILMAGQSFGIAFGLFVGGWLSHEFGWRMVFIIVGLPGILIALLMRFTVPEPARGMADGTEGDVRPSTKATLAFLWEQKSYRCILLGFALNNMTGYAILGWFPAFLMRVHKMNAVEVGFWMGATAAIGLVFGSLASGIMADRLGKSDRRWYLRVTGLAAFLMAPLGIMFSLWPAIGGVIAIFFLYKIIGGFVQAPAFAILQAVAPTRMRGSATFAITVVQNLAGVALGPLLVGIMNDQMAATYGVESIRYSLVIISIAAAFSGLSYILANRWIRADIERARLSAEHFQTG